LEPVVGDEQDQVVGTGARDEPAESVVGLPEDVGDLLPDPRVLVLRVVRMVGRDVVRERVLGPVDRDPHRGHQVPVRVVHQALGDRDPLRGDLEGLVEVRVGPVPVGGPAHPVDGPLEVVLGERLGQVGRVGEGAPLRQDPAGEEVPVDVRRRECERDVEQELVLAGGREVVEERPRLDRLIGDRVLLVGARLRLEDVVDAVVVGVDAGQERGPGRPRVRGDGGAEDLALAPVEEGLEVGQGALLQQGVEDAPVGAIPRDQDHS
jgi:hypothetical protein